MRHHCELLPLAQYQIAAGKQVAAAGKHVAAAGKHVAAAGMAAAGNYSLNMSKYGLSLSIETPVLWTASVSSRMASLPKRKGFGYGHSKW